jgi:cobalt-zinc-cadmium efflux system protein
LQLAKTHGKSECKEPPMSHNHDHNHDQHNGHAHAPTSFGMAFAIGITLNTVFVIIEGGYGILSNSMALLADAGHNLSDVLGLAVAWIAAILANRPPSARYTFGFKSSTILAALFNAVFLLLAVGAIGWEAILRLFNPEPVAGKTVMIVAAVGILINGITAWLFASGRKGDINIRGAYLHMASDAAVSAGVVAAGFVMLYTGWLWLDPIVSLAIVAIIVWSTWSLLRESLAMSLKAVPANIDAAAVRTFLEKQKGVTAIHDLHIWPMSTTDAALTAHLLIPGGHPPDSFLMEICSELRKHHGIGHATLQVETDPATACDLEPDHIV